MMSSCFAMEESDTAFVLLQVLFIFSVVDGFIERFLFFFLRMLHPLDDEFFEEYKRLDRICADMYSARQGVSEYIADMESRPIRETSRITAWDHDYKQLKHLRWIRNRIAHESDTCQICSISDIQDIQNFYNRILSGRDPIAMVERTGKSIVAESNRRSGDIRMQPQDKQYNTEEKESASYRNKRRGGLITAIILVIIIVSVMLWLFLSYNAHLYSF